MSVRTGRRGVFVLLASLISGGVARAQLPTPAPPVTPPLVLAPPSQPPAPRREPSQVSAIDKTKAYYVFFDQTIDVNTMRALRQQLARLVEAGVSDITLVIDSPGGQLEPMLITYSFIQALPARINTHAQGLVQSAATILFLAGENRSADRDARFVFHPISTLLAGTFDEEQLHEREDVFGSIDDMYLQIYHDRTKLPQAEIDRFEREMVIYTSDQALGFSIIQKVADLRLPRDGSARILFLN